jgi:uncharacterized protein YqjF (DUF2071 family)
MNGFFTHIQKPLKRLEDQCGHPCTQLKLGVNENGFDALVRVQWPRVLFLHYRIAPEVLRPHLPRNFQIELYDNSAWLTLVALTMRKFRPIRRWSPAGWLLRLRGEQRFLNVRTYVRHRDDSGAFFLWGWLSRPFNLPLPGQPFGLPCGFVDIRYAHRHEEGKLRGDVRAGERHFNYAASFKGDTGFSPPKPGSLAEFALERYNGFYAHRGHARIFRARHDPWPCASVDVAIEDDSLLETLPIFARVQLAAAHYTPGLSQVCLGLPRAVDTTRGHHGASSFFTMP